MNIAVPQSKAGRKPPFILILVAGTALGIAGAFGIWEVNQPSSGSGSVAVRSALAKYQYVGQDTRTLVLYLVDSPEQAEMVRLGEQEAANERASAGMADLVWSRGRALVDSHLQRRDHTRLPVAPVRSRSLPAAGLKIVGQRRVCEVRATSGSE